MDPQPHAICGPNSASDPRIAPIQDHQPDSELYWCPWLLSDLVIPDLSSLTTHPDTCALPTHPHYPWPLHEFATPAVTSPPSSLAFTDASPPLALLYHAVRSSGLPNYRGACLPVPHNINIQAWRQRSHLFSDPSLIEMLEFGFPHRLHCAPPAGTILRQPSFCHTAPQGCHSLHL